MTHRTLFLSLLVILSASQIRGAEPTSASAIEHTPRVSGKLSATEVAVATGSFPHFEGEFESAIFSYDLRERTWRKWYEYSAYDGAPGPDDLVNALQLRKGGRLAFDREDIGAIEMSGKPLSVGGEPTSDFVIDAVGNVYRTRRGDDERRAPVLEKWSPAGKLLQVDTLPLDATRVPVIGDYRTRIDLAADQCTLYYSGMFWWSINRFNVCTRTPLAPFTDIQVVKGFRLLKDGGMIVASADRILVYSAEGKARVLDVTTTEDDEGWVSFSVSNDGSSVWVAVSEIIGGGFFFRISLEDGSVIDGPYDAPLVDNRFGDDYPHPVTAIVAFDDWRAATGSVMRRSRAIRRP
jgi:hypothetical protein